MDPPDDRRTPALGRRTRLKAASAVCALFGVSCLGWVGWSLGESAFVQARAEQELTRARGEVAALPRTPEERRLEWAEPAEGDLVGRVVVRRLGISAIVHHGTSDRTLRRAVGHIPGTGLPGTGGNVGLAGHRDSFFRGLGEVRAGDLVEMETLHGDFTYRVEEAFVVEPHEVRVLDPPARGEGEVVTLVTCHPFYWAGPAPDRFIVHARLEASDLRVHPAG